MPILQPLLPRLCDDCGSEATGKHCIGADRVNMALIVNVVMMLFLFLHYKG
jgi:hypothetical protein